MLKNSAIRKESILKPSTILAHNIIINALMTNKNKPRVIIVTGNVSMTKIGLTIRFSSANTIATINEVVKPAT